MVITIVGVGALGSHTVQLIRNVGASIRVIDFDRVEQKNVQSQFHAKSGVGKAKVIALSQLMNFLYGVNVQTNSNKLVENNAQALLGESDLVVDCLDNGASRRVVQAYVRSKNIPCLHGALAPDGQFGRVIWDENFVVDDETAGAATCEDGEHLPFIVVVSAFIAQSVKTFVKNQKKIGFNVSPAGVIRI